MVDVAVSFRKSERDNPAAMVLLRSLQVLAVKGAMAAASSDQDREAQRRNNTVVLAVPKEKVPTLLLASEEAPGGTSTSTPTPLTGLAPWRCPQMAREPKLIWAARPGN